MQRTRKQQSTKCPSFGSLYFDENTYSDIFMTQHVDDDVTRFMTSYVLDRVTVGRLRLRRDRRQNDISDKCQVSEDVGGHSIVLTRSPRVTSRRNGSPSSFSKTLRFARIREILRMVSIQGGRSLVVPLSKPLSTPLSRRC